jgi:hypothetical protein
LSNLKTPSTGGFINGGSMLDKIINILGVIGCIFFFWIIFVSLKMLYEFYKQKKVASKYYRLKSMQKDFKLTDKEMEDLVFWLYSGLQNGEEPKDLLSRSLDRIRR